MLRKQNSGGPATFRDKWNFKEMRYGRYALRHTPNHTKSSLAHLAGTKEMPSVAAAPATPTVAARQQPGGVVRRTSALRVG